MEYFLFDVVVCVSGASSRSLSFIIDRNLPPRRGVADDDDEPSRSGANRRRRGHCWNHLRNTGCEHYRQHNDRHQCCSSCAENDGQFE
ncbi:hypothetical protein Aduo_011941 [Ancylostoma duodenale]